VTKPNPDICMGVAAVLAALGLYAYPLSQPLLLFDDFQIVAASWTWPSTSANLWLPANEHAMPLGRMLTWLLIELAGPLTGVPRILSLVGPVGLIIGMGLIYLFVRRELGHPLYGLLAMILFGVTTVYEQAVTWFAASFSILALDSLLLALLAAQRWRRTDQLRYLALSAACAAVAPAWFASGILAGPLCGVYLLPGASGRRRLAALVPILGSLAFLAVSLPRTAEHIMHLEHYEGRTAWESFQPLVGLEYTGRSLVDNEALGAVGISGIACPRWLVPAALIFLAGVGMAWWGWEAPEPAQRRLLLVGLACIGATYWLTYSARAAWGYDGMMYFPNWSRYHLFPQAGLVLLICAGWQRWEGTWFQLRPAGTLSPRQRKGLAALIVIFFVCQLPRAIAVTIHDPTQQEVLRFIEDVDARCRAHHIDADTARSVLGQLSIPYAGDRIDGWELLRGSSDAQPISAEEAERILEP
jgi:hypothetical protein